MTASILKQDPNTYKIQGFKVFKVFLSFWPLGARKRSYIRTRHEQHSKTRSKHIKDSKEPSGSAGQENNIAQPKTDK